MATSCIYFLTYSYTYYIVIPMGVSHVIFSVHDFLCITFIVMIM